MKKKFKRIFASLLVVIMLFASVPLVGNMSANTIITSASAASSNGPKLNCTSKSIYYKSNVTLKVSGTNSKITWLTSDKNIATVNSKGVVTGKSIGTATISAKFGKTTLKCKIIVKDRNQGAETSFKTSDGGIFIYATNTAVAKFKLKSYDSAKVTVSVLNSEDKSVYNKTFTSLKKNTYYQFNWDGKNTKGNIVPAGTYRIMVKAGTTKSYSAYLSFYTVNDFAGGSGSSKNPFQVKTVAQLKKIVKYSSANFKQMNDLDFNYSGMSGMFTDDKPFAGVYDGNGKTIRNIISNSPILNYSLGTIQNLKFVNCSVTGEGNVAILVGDNMDGGTVKNCRFEKCSVSAQKDHSLSGIIAGIVGGVLINCSASGTSVSSGIHNLNGGLTGGVGQSGKIIDCSADVNVTDTDNNNTSYYEQLGGLVGVNNGTIVNCEAKGVINGPDSCYGYVKIGGIAGYNTGTIRNSYYTGSSACGLVDWNKGVIS